MYSKYIFFSFLFHLLVSKFITLSFVIVEWVKSVSVISQQHTFNRAHRAWPLCKNMLKRAEFDRLEHEIEREKDEDGPAAKKIDQKMFVVIN